MKRGTRKSSSERLTDASQAPRGNDIFYRCEICQAVIPSAPSDNARCNCHNILIDVEYLRIYVKDLSRFTVIERGHEPAEPVSAILFVDENLHCVLDGRGQDSYQYIYREARSVYWEPNMSSFKCSASTTGMTVVELFRHILRITAEFGVTLSFPSPPIFYGLPDEAVQSIRAEIGI